MKAKKINKKETERVLEMTSDMIIAGQPQEKIIKRLKAEYITLGQEVDKVEEICVRAVKYIQDKIEGDRRLYDHGKPSTVDLDAEYEIILFIRDLFNLSPLLQNDLDEELLKFLQKLKAHGWGEKQIHNFITKAGEHTNFEFAQNGEGKRLVPRQIPERGDQKEYLRNRFRLSK